ncbi:MAG: AAA family ATPase [Nevskiaceae bacterium]|nr:MAG: AAA family ATPase [Nevskiaceae bacterium]TBR74797.1 MAG: AAA family ATPase [Nevskiaceae bacterium]
MYLDHFHLREAPFSIAPDPAYLYLSARHQEALGHLLYGTGLHGGFVQLTGEVGTGKTTIVRTLLRQKLDGVDVAMVHNPRQSEAEFVATICDEFHIDYPHTPTPSLKTLVDALNSHLLEQHAAGRRCVLIIDEAQNLAPEVLEQVRLLTNLETDKEKLLRIMLVGQPELVELLARRELRQLASRITARYHLLPLTEPETREYIAHRLHVAGASAALFNPAAIHIIHEKSRGVPRHINILCDRSLLGAYAEGLQQVTPAIVRRAATETLGEPIPAGLRERLRKAAPRLPLVWVEGAIACALLVLVGVLFGRMFQPSAHPHRAVPAASASPAAKTTSSASVQNSTAPDTTAPIAADAAGAASTNLGRILAHPETLGALTGRLVGLWNPDIRVGDGTNVCNDLSAQGLRCYRGSGSWSDLRQMDRPALLRLAAGSKTSQYVLLTGLQDDSATLDTGNGFQLLPAAQLRAAWTGEFLLLWRGTTGTNFIRPYSSGDAVVWLRNQLAIADGQVPPASPSPVFDAALTQQVVAYQRRTGLDADGLAGVATLISLSGAGHRDDTPTLLDVKLPAAKAP